MEFINVQPYILHYGQHNGSYVVRYLFNSHRSYNLHRYTQSCLPSASWWPKMITCFFGLPGAGKSTLLAKIAQNELKRIRKGKSKYKRVLSNYYLKGCQQLNFADLGKYDMSDSLILIDEISLYADSRDYKQFSFQLKQFFILHRHYNIDIVYATQQYDGVDRKIRELTQQLYYMKRAGPLTYATIIYRTITIDEQSEIKYGYRFPSLGKILSDIRHTIIFCWRPRYYKYFDSFDAPYLPPAQFNTYE